MIRTHSFIEKYCLVKIPGGKRCGNPLFENNKCCQMHYEMFKSNKSEKPKPKYYDYILSEEWKEKADDAKRRAKFRCQVCNRGPSDGIRLNAHHRTYDRLGHEEPEDITVLCETCHELFSRRGAVVGQKRNKSHKRRRR